MPKVLFETPKINYEVVLIGQNDFGYLVKRYVPWAMECVLSASTNLPKIFLPDPKIFKPLITPKTLATFYRASTSTTKIVWRNAARNAVNNLESNETIATEFMNAIKILEYSTQVAKANKIADFTLIRVLHSKIKNKMYFATVSIILILPV